MSVNIQLKHSSVVNKAPQPSDLHAGELALNINAGSPAAYIKDSAGNIVKLAGSGAVGATPATEMAAGVVELATAAETTTGTDATKAVHPAGLKVELDKKAPLASPALTGTPTAPTAAAGTNTTQLATTAFVTAAVAVENLWDRAGAVVSPANAGDQVHTGTGKLTVGGTAAAPKVEIKADGTGIQVSEWAMFAAAANPETGLIVNGAQKIAGLGNGDKTNPVSIDCVASGQVVIHQNNRANPAIRLDPGATGSPLVRDSSGKVGVGDPAPDSTVTIKAAAATTPLRVSGPSSEFLRCDQQGRLLVGTSSAFDSAAVGADYSIGIERAANYVSFALKSNIANATPSYLVFNKSRGTTLNSKTVVASGDALGEIGFAGSDGTNMIVAAAIKAEVDGTPGTNDMPGRLVFSVTPDSKATPEEAMRIKNSKIINFANAPTYADNATAKAGGLVAGDVYKKADGTLMITF